MSDIFLNYYFTEKKKKVNLYSDMNLLPLFQMSTNWVQPYSSFLQEVFPEQLEIFFLKSYRQPVTHPICTEGLT